MISFVRSQTMKTTPILALTIATALAAGAVLAQDPPPAASAAPGSFAPPSGPRSPDAGPPLDVNAPPMPPEVPGGPAANPPIPVAPPALPPPDRPRKRVRPGPDAQGAPVPPPRPLDGHGPQPPRPPRGPDGPGEPPAPNHLRPLSPFPAQPGRPQPFLGVITSPLPPALSAQLGLPEGFGLLVGEVLPDSPAAAAGIQRHDVLRLFNDQQLVEPNQLATLVRALGKDKDATLTLIRKGTEQQVTARIGERSGPERRLFLPPLGGAPGAGGGWEPGRVGQELQRWGSDLREGAEKMGDRLREQAERMQRGARGQADEIRGEADRLRERVEQERSKVEERVREHLHRPGAPAADVPPEDILSEARPGGGQIKLFNENRVTSWDGGKARLMLKDQDGEIEVAVDGGKRSLTAKDAKGTTVFSGPVDTDEQRQAVPEQFRKKLDQLNIRQQSEPPPAADPPRGAQAEETSPFWSRLPLIGQFFAKPLELPEKPTPDRSMAPLPLQPTPDVLAAPLPPGAESEADDEVQ